MRRIAIACLLAALGLPALAQQNCPPNNLIASCPNNVIELRKQQEAQRQAQIRAQQEAQIRAQQEAQRQAQIRAQQEAQRQAQIRAQQEAQKQAQIRAQQEAAQKAALQRQQQEAAQKAALQKAQQDAAQRAAIQKAQQDAAQKAAIQKAQQDAAQKAAVQRSQQEAAQKATLQKAQQDAAQRAAAQKAQQEAAQKAAAQQRAQQEAAQKAAYERKLREDAQRTLAKPASTPPPAPAPTQPTLAKPAPAPTQPTLAKPAPAPTQPTLAKPAPVTPATGFAQAGAPARTMLNQRNADGSNVVVQQSVTSTGSRQVTAYRQVEDPRTRTSTRTYLDGYRVTQAPTYVSRTLPNQATYTQYDSGLRSAALPGGKTVYKEQYVTTRTGGVERRTVQRTVYMAPAAGGYVPLKTQVVQVYEVVNVYQRPAYVYRPVRYAPVFFTALLVPFAAPLVAGPQCAVCPPPVPAYQAPQRYENSYDLLGDMQLAGPLVDDPLLPARDASGNVPAARGNARNEIDDLQRQLDQQARDNAELQAALSQTGMQRASFSAESPADVSRLKVPDRVREVMRKQVRLSVAQHQNGKPLLLSEIVESGFAPIYVFQAAAPIEVEDVSTGAPCRLAAGDLAEFKKVPDGSAPAAQMSIISSRPGHCEPNQVVHVKYEDLQEMLNAFSQRVEENMKKVNACITARGGCMKT